MLAGGHASAWFSPFWRGPAPGAQRYQAILVSALGLFLRKGGNVHELYAESPPAVNRQTHEVKLLWQAWARSLAKMS